ncbi:hypothetical protein PENTCL1PPCAC_29072, partial [Pristionchus entomophagus]
DDPAVLDDQRKLVIFHVHWVSKMEILIDESDSLFPPLTLLRDDEVHQVSRRVGVDQLLRVQSLPSNPSSLKLLVFRGNWGMNLHDFLPLIPIVRSLRRH